MSDRQPHWLMRSTSIRRLWIGFGLVLALTLLAGAPVAQHAHFGIESGFGFYAWFGFLTCVGMVVFAKVLGIFLKRPDDYYQGEHSCEERQDD